MTLPPPEALNVLTAFVLLKLAVPLPLKLTTKAPLRPALEVSPMALASELAEDKLTVAPCKSAPRLIAVPVASELLILTAPLTLKASLRVTEPLLLSESAARL